MAVKVRDKDRGYGALMRRLAAARGKHQVTVGIHEEEGAGPEGDSGATVGEVAAIHELSGRSFVRAYVDQQEPELRNGLREVGKGLVSGAVPGVAQGLGHLGQKAAGGMREFISSGDVAEPDDPETIARKGSSTPLVDTGNLLSKITSKVNK